MKSLYTNELKSINFEKINNCILEYNVDIVNIEYIIIVFLM